MPPYEADKSANIVDPDQTGPLGSALFSHVYFLEKKKSYSIFIIMATRDC